MRFRSDPDKIAFVTLPASYSLGRVVVLVHGYLMASWSAVQMPLLQKPKPRFSPSRGLLLAEVSFIPDPLPLLRQRSRRPARLACPIFLRSFGASHTVKCVEGSRFGDATAMMHDRRIVNARGI
jgi:hypothetical protein